MQIDPPIKTIVFDAYGTLFDVAAAAKAMAATPAGAALGDGWADLARDWRAKQLEYTWIRSMSGIYADFAVVTADALDWALDRAGLLADADLRAGLLHLYDTLSPFPEVAASLARLAAKGYQLAILSNGTPAMLAAATDAAGLSARFDAVLSVDHLRIYKPDFAVYALVQNALGVAPQNTLFVSANGWDIAGAARFGFFTVWVNRAALPVDRMPQRPYAVVPDLGHLPALLPDLPAKES